MNPSNHNVLWSHDELVLALFLYCQIPFAKTKANNPSVIKLASLLNRSPASVARKLGNLGAFDPILFNRGIKGLVHYSRADQEIWDRYYERWEDLLRDTDQLFLTKFGVSTQVLFDEKETIVNNDFLSTPSITQRSATVVVRVGQPFFRRTVLSSYNNICCVCGLNMPELLIASHIIPWAAMDEYRVDPKNGLSLCTLHDKAFDKGLITVTPAFKVLACKRVETSKNEIVKRMIQDYNHSPLFLPKRFLPNPKFLLWHNTNVFQKS